MRINDDHMYHGAALTQIAEHPRFTAINAFEVNGKPSRSAFRINDDIGVYVKYATEPTYTYGDYIFNFRREHLKELNQLVQKTKKVFVVLVCVKDKEICCISHAELDVIMDLRHPSPRIVMDEQCPVWIRLERGRRFRVYVTLKGKRQIIRGGEKVIPRNRFPGIIFASD